MTVQVAFLYIAEAYQTYYGAAIALKLAQAGVSVTTYYNDPNTPRDLERVRQAYDAPYVEYKRLRRSFLTRALQAVRKLGLCKPLVLLDNRRELAGFDAIVAVEDTAGWLKRLRIGRSKLIYYPHGAGDRARGFTSMASHFDYVLLSGEKLADRMIGEGLVRQGRCSVIGSVKVETATRVRSATAPLFANELPTVLYNPHKAPELSSWGEYAELMIEHFRQEAALNLIVAPHVKLFHRKSATVRQRWEARSSATILIDTGSDRSVDMTYTQAADIYVGDASSQVYEFLLRPRPCVFINHNQVRWRDDPSFAHWHLGDVVSKPDQLMPAIKNAAKRHALYRARQEMMTKASLGEYSEGAAQRAASEIIRFLDRTSGDDLPYAIPAETKLPLAA
jgi:hypothetical protein